MELSGKDEKRVEKFDSEILTLASLFEKGWILDIWLV